MKRKIEVKMVFIHFTLKRSDPVDGNDPFSVRTDANLLLLLQNHTQKFFYPKGGLGYL